MTVGAAIDPHRSPTPDDSRPRSPLTSVLGASYPGRIGPAAWMAYGFPVLVTAATLLLRLALDAPLGGQPTLVLFTVPILLSAHVAGMRAGLLATVLSCFAASYLLPPFHGLQLSRVELWQQCSLALAGVLVSVLSEAHHRARRRAGIATSEHLLAGERGERSQQRLRDLIDGLGPSIFVGLMTPEGTLIEANHAALAAAGLKPQDVLGRPFAETYWWTHSGEVQQQLREAIVRAARGEASRYDVRLRAANNQLIDVDFSLQVLRNEEGEVAFLVPSASVITDRKRAEAALQRSEKEQTDLVRDLEAEKARLVAAQTVAHVGSWESDQSTFATAWSEEMYRIFETTRDEYQPTRQGFLEFVHPDDRAAVDEALAPPSGGPETGAIEHRLLMADGRIKFVQEHWQSFSDEQGRLLRVVGTCQDVSARKHAEKAFEELSLRTERRERMLNTTLSSIRDFVYVYDREGRFLFANQPLLDLLGITLEQAVGKSVLEMGYPDDLAQRLHRQVQEIVETKRSLTAEASQTSPDGADVDYESIFAPVLGTDGKVEAVVGSTRNITEHNRTVQALRTSVEEFRTLAESMPQMVWIARSDGFTVWLNQQWMEYSGLTLEESVGQGWTKPFHPEDLPTAWAAWQHARATSGTYSVECRLRRTDGVYRWWLVRGVPVRDPAGNILKWFGTCTDIHDLKMAELEISRSKERFATVFQSNLIALGISEKASGRFIDVNSRACELFGYTRGELIGHTASELGLWADPADRQRLIDDLSAGNSPSRGEVSIRRKSGEVRHALVSVEDMTLTGTTEPLVVSGIMDITEHKELEAQLLQSQKMEAVGRLAGGVAHDFNNSLGVILGYAELLMRRASEPQKGKLEQILKATQRASGLTRQLLAFSRRQVVDPRVLDLNALVSDLEKMLGRLIGEDIDLAIVAGEDLGQVKADPGQLEQVVINLCVNARDAMPGGGLLSVETANVELATDQVVRHEPMTAGRYVMLAVGDSGCGIEKGILTKIFEPFFTTKELGKGTGLGLAMVYGTVKQAGGQVLVESEVGRGTTFKIYLPRIDEPVEALEVREPPQPSRGSETILLVEDEDALREIAGEVLEEHGYRVLAASGPQEAIDIALSHPEPIHLLVTDVVMPAMNGRALATSLVAARPTLRVLYMSGYTDDAIAHSGVLESGTLFIEKPFTVAALLERVREALGQPGLGESS